MAVSIEDPLFPPKIESVGKNLVQLFVMFFPEFARPLDIAGINDMPKYLLVLKLKSIFD